MSFLGAVSKLGISVYAVSAIIPLSKSDAWWIRAFDFPRLQLLFVGLVFAALYLLVSGDRKAAKLGILSVLLVATCFDLYRVLPYSAIWPRESRLATVASEPHELSLITVNVFQENKEPAKLLSLIEDHDPDIVFLLEVNERWLKDLAPLDSAYTFQIEQPQENEYGLALYSRLPIENAEIRFLIEPEIPSVRAEVVLASGDRIEVFGLHPQPPRPQDGATSERDAELVQVAKTVRNSSNPVIVMGDLNDVAWSHTTRLFRRISGLLDPRVGQESFPTFPVQCPLLRYPLDYVFHSSSLTINSVERLDDIGSDHFPMYAKFTLESRKPEAEPKLDEGDMQEADDTIRRAKENDEK